MEDWASIGAVGTALTLILGLVARIRSFEQSIRKDLREMVQEEIVTLNTAIAKKADKAEMENAITAITSEVENMSRSMTDFIGRMDKHVETFYEQDKNLEREITDIRIEQARREGH